MASKVKLMQKNWIGKSLGCEINFELDKSEKGSKFLQRDRTLYSTGFIALSIDHSLSSDFEHDNSFKKFKEQCNKTGTTEEAIANAEKYGFKTGLFVIHPFEKTKKLPVLF